MMEHRINVVEGVKPDSTNYKPKIDPSNISRSIEEKFGQLRPFFPRESCVYRVHKGLRDVKPEAYTPMVVSIGPYHHGNEQLCAMEEQKLRCLQSLLERRKENTESYILALAKLEEEARKFYADPIDLNPEAFVEMMLVDGCFIIEFLRKNCFDSFELVEWALIQRDMILLENQLPYSVLTKLYDMTKEDQISLEAWVIEAFDDMLPHPISSGFQFGGSNDTQIRHLLHLVHIYCCPLFEPSISSNEVQMLSAVELCDFGVMFEKVDKESTGDGSQVGSQVGLFDIKFANGLMEIPCLKVDDTTETFFRNLVAFEQHSSDVYQIFTDYITFMDQLINSKKDVNLLRLKGIIDNWLGDDQEVCELFNGMGVGVFCSSASISYYSKVYEKVQEHCKKPWNEKKAKLKHNYFNNPWAGISTLAAGVLLLLTLLQTIAAFTNW